MAVVARVTVETVQAVEVVVVVQVTVVRLCQCVACVVLVVETAHLEAQLASLQSRREKGGGACQVTGRVQSTAATAAYHQC